MTEADWIACDNPRELVGFLHRVSLDRRIVCRWKGAGLPRRLRLFVCATCRLHWGELTDERSRTAVETVERYADGLAKRDDLRRARRPAELATRGDYRPALYRAAEATALSGYRGWDKAWRAASDAPVSLVRCVFGDAFRLDGLDPDIRTPCVASLARAAYSYREEPTGHLDTARLAVLSDALEEAGCDDEAVLSHLRSPGPHVRGCWALGLVSGKE